MESEFQRPISGKNLDLFLTTFSQALKDSGVNVKARDDREQKIANALKVNLWIGINAVTRTLERMPDKNKKVDLLAEKLARSTEACDEAHVGPGNGKTEKLQAILVATDVHPKLLISHLGHLCNSRGVPMVCISGGEGMGSLRLGEVLGLRTAIVVGVKAGTSPINTAVQTILKK